MYSTAQVDVPLKEAKIKSERLGDEATFLLTMEVGIYQKLDPLDHPHPFLFLRSLGFVSPRPEALLTLKRPKPAFTHAKFSSDSPRTCSPICRALVCVLPPY